MFSLLKIVCIIFLFLSAGCGTIYVPQILPEARGIALSEGQEKINLDRMKAMMNQSDKQDKLDQNEKLAKLRANTSIEKTILSKSIPNVDKMMPSVEIEKYEGENR